MKTTTTLHVSSLLALLVACKPEPATQPPVQPEPAPAPVAVTPAPTPAPEPVVTWPDEPYRAARPAPAAIAELKLPKIESFKLANGLEVFLVPNDRLPTVLMQFEFEFGGVSDSKDKLGMHSLCMDLLDEGTARLDKVAFEERQADHAVGVGAFAGSDTAGLMVRALRRELPAALDLLAEMLREPGLRQEDFDRLKERRKAAILQQKGNPAAIGGRVAGALLWGEGHPYGRVETEQTIDALKLDDCKKVVGKIKPGGARLWVVGQITADEIKQELATRLPEWKGKAPSKSALAPAKPQLGKIFFVHVKDAPQSSVYVGHAGPKRSAPDYESTDLMAEILGGSFASRINMNLREDKGITYGSRAGFGYRRAGSTFTASGQIRTDGTALALREMAKEIATMRTTDAKPEELFRVQEGALLALPAEFDTPSAVLGSFQGLRFHGLPFDWYEGHQKRLKAVDLPAIRKAAEKHLREKDFVVLVVGDGAKVLPDLDAMAKEKLFGGGGVVVIDADGRPTKRPE